MNELKFPKWVKPSKLVIGDSCHEKIDNRWVKKIFTGRRWVKENDATEAQKIFSFRRARAGMHIITSRKL